MEDKSHHASDGLMKLTFEALKEITDNFSKERKIGSGTFGDVYKGQLKDGKVIAVKMLRQMPEIDGSQFENELELLKKLDHQNIVQLVGLCNEEGLDFVMHKGNLTRMQVIHRALCLEFVPNGNVGKLLSDNFLVFDWDMRFKIIKGICQGIRHLHKLEIMHLDLKPDNILLDEEMVPKIVDFGLSKIRTADSMVANIPLGTTGYIPPEFTENQIISDKYDIFSLGITIKKIVDSSIDDVTDKEIIEDVLENWKKRLLQIRGYGLSKVQGTFSFQRQKKKVENVMEEVRTCIEIATDCTKRDRHDRPTMDAIIYKLDNIKKDVAARRKMVFKDDEQPPRNDIIDEGEDDDDASSDDLVRMSVNYANSGEYAKLTADTVKVMVSLHIKRTDQVREHLDLVAVLDVSESMGMEAIENMKTAMRYVVMKLTPFDRISIVTFSNEATRRCPLRCVSEDGVYQLEAILRGVQPETTATGTNMKAGLDTAMAILNCRVHKKARNAAIFLMSSGQQNKDDDARRVNTGKVSIYTFGFNEEDADKNKLLSDIAQKSSRGRYTYLSGGPNFCEAIHKLLLPGLLTLAVQDLKLTVIPQMSLGEVETLVLNQAFGVREKQTTVSASGAITIHFGDVASGEMIRTLFDLKLLPSEETDTYDTDSLVLIQYSYTTQSAFENGEPQDVLITRTAPSPPSVYTSYPINIKIKPTGDDEVGIIETTHPTDNNNIIGIEITPLYGATARLLSNNEVRIEGPPTRPTDGSSTIISDLTGELQQLLGLIKPQKKVGPYDFDYASVSSSGRQRYTAKGDNIFSSLRMDAYHQLQQANKLADKEALTQGTLPSNSNDPPCGSQG